MIRSPVGSIFIYDTDLKSRLFLGSLLSSLGDLATLAVRLLDSLDDTDGDSDTHVTDGETAKGRVLVEVLDTEGLGRDHLDDGRVTGLDELGRVLNLLVGTLVNLLNELSELAGNVSSVAVENRGVTGGDLTRVVEDNDLSVERVAALGRVVLRVTGNVTTTNVLDRDVLDVETNVVTGDTLSKLLVVHLDRLDFGGDVRRSEGDNHTGLDDTGLDTADRDSSDTADLVDILERQTEGLVRRTNRGLDRVDGLKKGLALEDTGLGLTLPALVPRGVGGGLNHVVTVPARDGDEGNSLGVVADLLDEVRGLLDDLLETLLRPLDRVHLVDGDNELLDTKGVGEKSVLTGLTVLRDTSLELTNTTGNDENGTVGLRSTGNHVLDEVTVTGGINNGDVVLGGLELPESNVNGDTTLTLSLQLVKNPGVLERTLTELGSLLLELLDGTLVNTTALVDKVTGGGRLAGIDVADNDDVKVKLFLSLFVSFCFLLLFSLSAIIVVIE